MVGSAAVPGKGAFFPLNTEPSLLVHEGFHDFPELWVPAVETEAASLNVESLSSATLEAALDVLLLRRNKGMVDDSERMGKWVYRVDGRPSYGQVIVQCIRLGLFVVIAIRKECTESVRWYSAQREGRLW